MKHKCSICGRANVSFRTHTHVDGTTAFASPML